MTQTMKVSRDFKGIWIPRQIYLHRELSWTEKILLVEIDSLDCGEGCFASNEYFAKFLGKSVGQISTAISHLRSLNLIDDRGFDGRKRYISVKVDYRKTSRQTTGKPVGRLQENPAHNNTLNNIPLPPETKKSGIGKVNVKWDIEEVIELWVKETGKGVSGSEFYAAQLELSSFLSEEVGTGLNTMTAMLEAIKNYGQALRLPNTKVWKNRNLVDFIRKCKNFLPGYFNIARYRDEFNSAGVWGRNLPGKDEEKTQR
ncbi:unnamed protein product, partial [marine sediment metagenome]